MRRLPFSILLGLTVSFAFLPGVSAKEPKMKDMTDTVLSNRIMTKFALLLRYSELASFLSSRGPFTLFAPTDSAFSRISPDTYAALEQPENKEILQRIILFHIVNGQRITAKDMVPLKTLPSCEGHPLVLHVTHSGAQLVSKSKILHADIRCLNGLIHEVDTVLLPPGLSLSALAVAPPPAVNAGANPAPPANDAPAAPSDSTNAEMPTNAPSSMAPQ